MKAFISCLLAIVILCGCGIEESINRIDQRYLQPGTLDLPLTNYYDTYQYKFLGKYWITHQWPVSAGSCNYRSLPTLGRNNDRYQGEIYAVPDIYEENGKTYQASNTGRRPMEFDRYVRSVKVQSPIYGTPTKEELQASEKAQWERIERRRKTGRYESETTPDIVKPIGYEEKEVGFQSLCFESWWVTSHFLRGKLHKRDLATWRAMLTEKNPNGKWSERRVGPNVWLVQETSEQDLWPRPLNGVGGPFQTWLLPIGDTGYTIGMELGASRESLQYPDAHERMKAMFRHLIESVKIEPLQP